MQLKAFHVSSISIVIVFISTSVFARSGNLLKAFEGVGAIDVELTIGGGLGVEPDIALQLFAGDLERAREFEFDIKEAAIDALTSAGFQARAIAMTERPNHDFDGWMAVAFFGRPVETDRASANYVFLVSLDTGRYDTSGRGSRGTGSHQLLWSRKVIGVSAERNLEANLQRIFISLLEEITGNGRSNTDNLQMAIPGGR